MGKTVGQPYRHASEGVAWKPTKWDGFSLVKTEHPYRHQKGSGRSECFNYAEDGITVGEWTKRCAEKGFESKFSVGSLLKLQGAKQPGWLLSQVDDQGRTVDQVKKERDMDPAKAALKAEHAANKAKEREAKAAEREQKRKEAAEKRALEKAAAQARETAEGNEAATPKPKGSRKKAAAAPVEGEEAA